MTATQPPENQPSGSVEISRREAFLFWLKLGFISFGGPAGQIALMHEELVARRRWLSERRFLHALNYCMLLPGPEAQQLATYLGWLLHRSWGGVVAGLLFILPSLVLLMLLAWVYLVYGDLPLIAGVLYAIKPVVVVVVFQAAWRIGGRVLRNRWLWAIALAAFAAIFALGLPFPLIVLAAAVAGAVGGRLRPTAFAPAAHAGDKADTDTEALINDASAAPEHARFRLSRLLMLLVIGALLWCLPMGVLMLWQGWEGPLIMVVVFVAFLGGYQGELIGAGQPLAGGMLAALLVCWFTFLPSFLFVLGGAPLIEATRGELRLNAALTGVSAAVVGVIVNLALFFAWHVFMPGTASTPDWLALGIALVAAGLLFGRGWTVLQALLLSAAAGLVLGWSGLVP
ncbi:chromate transporter [Halopseudomonas sp.]|uniref:chromate transporter n=1 Tax=Halopseudomonas sp. TaxID=2901191 RepID=UPI00311D3081